MTEKKSDPISLTLKRREVITMKETYNESSTYYPVKGIADLAQLNGYQIDNITEEDDSAGGKTIDIFLKRELPASKGLKSGSGEYIPFLC